MRDVFIYEAIRSPRTKAKDSGGLADLTPQALLASLYNSLTERTGLDPADVGEIILGCVTQHREQAANIAKTSALYAGWPSSVGGLTVNRFCSSSIDAMNLGMLKVASGQEEVIVAGGVEMMSRIPMLSDEARAFKDPAFAAQCQLLMMGSGADLIATLHDVSREEADAIAVQSQQRAAHAQREGYFKSIVPVENPDKGMTVSEDECIRASATTEGLAKLPAAFAGIGAKGVDAYQLAAHPDLTEIQHIHTAGNSPAMADAATVVVLGTAALGEKLGIAPRARLVAGASCDDDPLQVLSGCVSSAQKLMQQQGLSADDVDLFEVHEAFAATVVKCRQDLGIDDDKLNVNGGVIALGHPMGATGAIMAGVLLDELERRDLKRGIVSASGAGGSGSALLIER
ncbi:acetyl-CoA acetyltransferase [Halioglobus japonicus]|uniref:Acetyl-CoA C-acyltransferase n=1 Tax=Halioglobus japonicus TaxID=930805 RepID=A0AAP8MD63_9GAMM|nr:acetyl-CoA C-acyltransferase [Halioglobus japonicus]AQA17651.1 acetyl-CoA acetyltransferase [Halioglobus japonicus]PLW85596.1 acetyl-CoA C-acyltransferase [Halioglobus japonicus]GHD16455.1 acetyl-CoA acetyltransferase [Halioglobus japonicus]